MNTRTPSSNAKQAGLASFMVTTVLIMVIALIIIGFSQVARRNQQEALDRQLNNQAFYAAESGINQAIAIVNSKVANGQEPPSKNVCGGDSNYPAIELSNADQVSVTCLLVENQVKRMVYEGVQENAPTVVPIIPANGAMIGKLVITWRNEDQSTSAGCRDLSSPTFTLPTRASWTCGHGILRAELAQQPTGSVTTGASVFAYPYRVGGNLSESTIPATSITTARGLTAARCSDAGNDPKCMVALNNLNAPLYYLGLRSIYKSSSVSIRGWATDGTELQFKGQVQIDVTAKAQDVIKRIQVRAPVLPQSGMTPAYGIESTNSLCKRYSVYPGDYRQDSVAGCP